MNRDIDTVIQQIWPELSALGVEHLDVFGSHARGEATCGVIRAAAGLRDVLVRDYFGIDVNVLAQVLADELPALRIKLVAMIGAEGWTPKAHP